MVKIPAARMVILSLSLLQMGLITSVLAAPTSAAVVPVHPQEHSKAMGPVASRPFHCLIAAPAARVQKRMLTEESMEQQWSPAEVGFVEEICKKENNHYDFKYFMSLPRGQIETMVSIIEKMLEDPDWENVRERGLQRISKWRRDPFNWVAKEGVVFWFDALLLEGRCSDATGLDSSKYNCSEGTDMYPDWLAFNEAREAMAAAAEKRFRLH
ncbi:hypothetical protein EV360DRAFT_74823 [Lentinula raphanica]|nr:hypothetical protein EV360DRAFT_74823 [Lentinula raphanica]